MLKLRAMQGQTKCSCNRIMESNSSMPKMTCTINKRFYLVSIGTMMTASAFVGILFLQSSINFAQNLGTTCLSILYACALVLLLFFTPFMLTEVGPKWCLVLGEAGFLVYTIGNFYPSFYTMVPGAVIGSVGAALMWPTSTIYITHLAKEYWAGCDVTKETSQSLDHLRNHFFGIFFSILKCCQIVGNLLSYAVLYGGKNLNVISASNTSMSSSNFTSCASQYCQVLRSADTRYKYVPRSRLSIYLLIAVFAGMQATAVIVHSVFLPRIAGDNLDHKKKSHLVVLESIKSSFRHMISMDSFLLTPTGLYYGLIVGYSASNFTRAYVSCTIGVQKVGLVLATYGALNVVSSFLVGRLAHRFGLNPVIICGVVSDTASWTLQLLWKPTHGSRNSVYALGAMLGVSDGIWQTTSASITAVFFSDRLETAFGTLGLFTVVGLFISFIISGHVCVRIQIYMMYGVLACTALGYTLAEWRRQRRLANNTERERLLNPSENEN